MNALKGRTNRATYWLTLAVLAVLIAVIAAMDPRNAHISEVVLIFLCVPRLHDVGRTGWYVAAPLALEVVGAIVAFSTLGMEDAMIVMGLITLVIFGLVAWLGAIPGEAGPNRFGEPPRPGIQWTKPPRRRAD